jgi:penicillin-binding protein 1A
MPSDRRRIEIENRSDGGLFYWLFRLYSFAFLGTLFTGLYTLFGIYVYFAARCPPLPDLRSYANEAPGVTTLYGQDGSILAELATQRREIVALDKIPQSLIDAFVATEDRRFFTHGGIDYRGTLRALLANLRAGQVSQGGSTITQQVAKSYLSSERSYTRKIREAILARRLEARYSKREILALYLNQIYLGNGAYGVQAAAKRYFDKDVWELDLGEQAMIAGLAQAPSRDSPLVSETAAKKRRGQVLANLVAVGALSDADFRKWADSPMHTRPRRDYFHEVAPYYAEHVRRYLAKTYGENALYTGGYRVETGAIPALDLLAAENVDVAVRKLDKRQGWRGPEAHFAEGSALGKLFRSRATELYGSGPLVEDKLYLGIVEKSSEDAKVRVGGRVYPLPVTNMLWAAKYSASDATNDKVITNAREAIKPGDVVWVRWAYHSRIPRFSDFTYNEEGDAIWTPEQNFKKPPSGPQQLMLEQQPRVQGSLYSFDHQTGYVVSMAGGDDFDASEFNRVVQSCRQPGSAYKPIYYSLALDHGYAFDTLWNDRPKPEVDPVTGELWVPENIDGSYGVQVTLERALVWSKNPPSGEIFATLGTKAVSDWHEKLGFSTPLSPSDICLKKYCPSLALGASCVHTDDLARAFAVFARDGKPIDTVYVRRVIDRRGRVVEDHTSWDDPLLDGESRLDRINAKVGADPQPVIPPRTAWLTSTLLRKIVTDGHSAPIRAIKIPAAGKTGTSSRTSDVWFIGYTSKVLTSAWIGDDTYERQLGYKDASFMLSVPMWARYMAYATGETPLEEIPWTHPAGVKNHDIGGPLKNGFPLPPALGVGPDGKPYALPDKLKGTVMTSPNLPPNLAPQKIIRVPGAPPKPEKPAP